VYTNINHSTSNIPRCVSRSAQVDNHRDNDDELYDVKSRFACELFWSPCVAWQRSILM